MGVFDGKISPEEIDKALNKITNQYSVLGKKYGAHFFNYQAFRNRYLDALKKKFDMKIFFKGETSYLEQQEEVAKKKIAENSSNNYPVDMKSSQEIPPPPPENKAIENTINRIIAQTDGYPEVDLPGRANIEIKRLVGMCRMIYPELSNLSVYVPVERSTIFYQESKVLQDVIQEPYGFTFKSYLVGLENDFLPQSQLDRIGQKLLKELGVALQTILSILRATDPVKVGHMVEYIAKAVIDFRLDIFQGLV